METDPLKTQGGEARTILDALNEDYAAGKFEVFRNDLLGFLSDSRPQLIDFFSANFALPYLAHLSEEKRLEALLKQYILSSRAINPISDARDQLNAIYEHLWILGEKLNQPPDREKEAREWIEKYAKSWREYRIYAILFVLERNLDFFTGLLMSSGTLDEVRKRLASGHASPVRGA